MAGKIVKRKLASSKIMKKAHKISNKNGQYDLCAIFQWTSLS